MINQQTLYSSVRDKSRPMSTSNPNIGHKASNEIFVGKKPLMTYVTATLVQLANEPIVIIKARGKSITRAVDVAQIIVKRMDMLGYKMTTRENKTPFNYGVFKS